jgi:hypothetical protein
MHGNSALSQQLQTDLLICRGDTQKANMSGVTLTTGGIVQQAAQELQREEAAKDVMKGCLAQKGYVLVPEQEAETRAAQFRANAQSTLSKSAKAQ